MASWCDSASGWWTKQAGRAGRRRVNVGGGSASEFSIKPIGVDYEPPPGSTVATLLKVALALVPMA
jgi:hypothetical protein